MVINSANVLMWYLHFQVTPDPDQEYAGKFGGAEVVCWVDTDDEGIAITAAEEMLAWAGWIMHERLNESYQITRETQSEKGLQLFEQAKVDGIAYRIYAWPVEDAH